MALAVGCGREELRPGFGCPEFQVSCEGACTDTSRSAEHCGACGAACAETEECIASKCRPLCDAEETLCASGCTNLESDSDNCGSCKNACEPGQTCRGGRCTGSGCPDSQLACGGVCVDPATNPLHCGGCSVACGAGLVCVAGQCTQTGCGPNQLACDGQCVDPNTDAAHCGNCVTACAAQEQCQAGACVPTCARGLTACGEWCVDLESDLLNCGVCFNYCALGRTCVDGLCCPPGDSVCDERCVDLASDAEHCGACGKACGNGVCSGGLCQPVCGPGLNQCGGDCVDVNSDVNHCGTCDNSCGEEQVCQSGQCECSQGLTLCEGACVDLTSDPEHCGQCGTTCAVNEVCAGTCELTCPAPTMRCGNSCVETRIDENNCGGCGVTCASDEQCRGGACVDADMPCDWSNSSFPYALNGSISVSDVTVDDECNLYVGIQRTNTDDGGYIFAIPYQSSEAIPILQLPRLVRGLAYRPSDGLLYAASLDRIVALNTDGSGARELSNSQTAQYLNGMTVSPSSFGQVGDQLIVAQSSGAVFAFDPDNDGLVTTLATLDAFISDVEFDGQQLYVAVYGSSSLARVTPAGEVVSFASLPCSPDGLTINPGQNALIACGSSSQVLSVSLPQGEISQLGAAVLNPGWAPSGMLWDSGQLFLVQENAGLTVFTP